VRKESVQIAFLGYTVTKCNCRISTKKVMGKTQHYNMKISHINPGINYFICTIIITSNLGNALADFVAHNPSVRKMVGL
jgi:hypothetical protein